MLGFIWKFFSKSNRTYQLKKEGNGVYVFVISGSLKIGDTVLNQRDALGITETDHFDMEIEENSEVLLIEVPMSLPRVK
jgi:redox-sensitive bicupin YhaK (pirin superfamily)